MRQRLLFLVLAVVLAVGFAPAPFRRPGKPRDSIKQLVGTWRLLDRPALNGRMPVPGRDLLEITLGRMTFNPGPNPVVYTLVLDPTKKPATFDITGTESAIGLAGMTFQGIYRLKGDTLTLCYNPPGEGRPTAFEGPGAGIHTEVFRRRGPGRAAAVNPAPRRR
jgi:uncharacterized protein (TIGR03067 family)